MLPFGINELPHFQGGRSVKEVCGVLSSLILEPRIRHANSIGFRWALALHTNGGLYRLAFDRKIFLLAPFECSSDDLPVFHGLDDCEPMPEGSNGYGDRRDPD